MWCTSVWLQHCPAQPYINHGPFPRCIGALRELWGIRRATLFPMPLCPWRESTMMFRTGEIFSVVLKIALFLWHWTVLIKKSSTLRWIWRLLATFKPWWVPCNSPSRRLLPLHPSVCGRVRPRRYLVQLGTSTNLTGTASNRSWLSTAIGPSDCWAVATGVVDSAIHTALTKSKILNSVTKFLMVMVWTWIGLSFVNYG